VFVANLLIVQLGITKNTKKGRHKEEEIFFPAGIAGMEIYSYSGHAPGHISLYRQRDGVLLTGDAFVTTKQESAISVILQTREISGPPKYFTYNWGSATRSVRGLAE
jgi:hypothetical protein